MIQEGFISFLDLNKVIMKGKIKNEYML